MFTVTIHMAPIGTPLANGKTSDTGHMYYTLDDGSGNPPLSFGFAPIKEGAPFWPGEPHMDDNKNYLDTNPNKHIETRTIEITQAEYDAMKNFGENPAAYGFDTYYNGLTNNCIDFTWKAMEVAGFNPSRYDGAMLPSWNLNYVQSVWAELQKRDLSDWSASFTIDELGRITVHPICMPKRGQISNSTNTLFGNARNWVAPRDPLVLDLDGGGITTSAINPDAPILFDQNGDGIKTASGWIGAGEAIVVRDVNNNGTIDSGRELFGDSTLLTQGARAGQLAANGFEALADLDSNQDGQFNSADAAFASVKLWKDANQDGISQSSELFSFDQLGVQSINVAGTASNVDLGGGNTQAMAGSFNRTNAAVLLQMQGNSRLGSANEPVFARFA